MVKRYSVIEDEWHPQVLDNNENNDNPIMDADDIVDALNEKDEKISELENAIIDLKACLRTCANSAQSGLDQHKLLPHGKSYE